MMVMARRWSAVNTYLSTYRHVARHEGREVALTKHGNGCDPRRCQCSGDRDITVIGGATESDQAGPLT